MKYSQPLPYQLINSSKKLKQQIKDRAESGEAKSIPYQLLSLLDKEGKTLMELAAQLHCSKQEVSRLVQRAEKNDWVLLKPDPSDGRSKRVFYSDTGKHALKDGLRYYRDLEISWEQQLGKEKVTLLKALLLELDALLEPGSPQPQE